jgi:FAD/FMN-containing dehydrogenase
MTTAVPVGTTPAALDRALSAFAAELGADAVITEPAGLREYRDPYTYRESDQFDAAAALTPVSTGQVQAIVAIANEHRIPLWTFGQGHNNTYGGPAPRLRGSVVVNLRGMNRVLEVNSELAYAVVEPGVRWFDLYDALRAAGGDLMPSIPDLGWGSVIGNSLEYGIGYTPYGDHARNICGLEVVLPDGSLLRTGMGAMEGNAAWHAYPHSFGPSFGGLFQQSNLGIVTSMGVWVMRRPETYAACWVRFTGFEALGRVVDALRGLLLDRTIENLPLLNRGAWADDNGEMYPDPGDESWSGRFALYGRASLVDAQYAVVAETLRAIPGVTVGRRTFDGTDLAGQANHDERVQRGIPDMDLLDPARLPYGENTAHLDFSPVGPCTGESVVRVEKLVKSTYERHGHGYVNGLFLTPRSTLQISTTFYDSRDERQTREVFDGYTDLVKELAAIGYAPYRTNLQHMDLVAGLFGFGDGAQLRLAEAIKDALDPNGILAPGKSGIWPAGLRAAR